MRLGLLTQSFSHYKTSVNWPLHYFYLLSLSGWTLLFRCLGQISQDLCLSLASTNTPPSPLILGARFHFLPSQFLLILGRNPNSSASFLCHQLYSTGPVVEATSLRTFDMIWFSFLNIYRWTIGQ